MYFLMIYIMVDYNCFNGLSDYVNYGTLEVPYGIVE
jgi:hypothetical protein